MTRAVPSIDRRSDPLTAARYRVVDRRSGASIGDIVWADEASGSYAVARRTHTGVEIETRHPGQGAIAIVPN